MTIDVKKGAVCAALAATLIVAVPVAVGPPGPTCSRK